MEQNGLKNENDAKARSPPQAAGASKSPKKRRKVNHGALARPFLSFKAQTFVE
jgi:hypothetical protein